MIDVPEGTQRALEQGPVKAIDADDEVVLMPEQPAPSSGGQDAGRAHRRLRREGRMAEVGERATCSRPAQEVQCAGTSARRPDARLLDAGSWARPESIGSPGVDRQPRGRSAVRESIGSPGVDRQPRLAVELGVARPVVRTLGGAASASGAANGPNVLVLDTGLHTAEGEARAC